MLAINYISSHTHAPEDFSRVINYDKDPHGMTKWKSLLTEKDLGGDEWLITLTEKWQLSREQGEV